MFPLGVATLTPHEQPRMNAARSRFRDAVDRVRVLASHPDLDNAGIVLDQLPHGFAAQAPQLGKLADPVMLLESGVINQHSDTNSARQILPAPYQNSIA